MGSVKFYIGGAVGRDGDRGVFGAGCRGDAHNFFGVSVVSVAELVLPEISEAMAATGEGGTLPAKRTSLAPIFFVVATDCYGEPPQGRLQGLI